MYQLYNNDVEFFLIDLKEPVVLLKWTIVSIENNKWFIYNWESAISLRSIVIRAELWFYSLHKMNSRSTARFCSTLQ